MYTSLSLKYLGVILNNRLSWPKHVAEVCKHSMRTLAQLKMNGDVFNLKTKHKLITSLIFPIFHYTPSDQQK